MVYLYKNRIVILSSVGFILSLYACYVEYKIHQQHEHEQQQPFVALCDIDLINASCSKVFQLPIGKMLSYFHMVPIGHILDVPNPVLGCIYYIQQLLFQWYYDYYKEKSTTTTTKIVLPMYMNMMITCGAMTSSIILAFYLTFIIHDLCILCWTTHIINATLFYDNVIVVVAALLRTRTHSNNKESSGTSSSSTNNGTKQQQFEEEEDEDFIASPSGKAKIKRV